MTRLTFVCVTKSNFKKVKFKIIRSDVLKVFFEKHFSPSVKSFAFKSTSKVAVGFLTLLVQAFKTNRQIDRKTDRQTERKIVGVRFSSILLSSLRHNRKVAQENRRETKIEKHWEKILVVSADIQKKLFDFYYYYIKKFCKQCYITLIVTKLYS
jgi:hypothetical protein